MYSLYYLVLSWSLDLCTSIAKLYRTYYLYYFVLHCSLGLFAAYLNFSSSVTQTISPFQHYQNWWQPLLTLARFPLRDIAGAPVPSACSQTFIILHFPVPIGSTWPIKPTKTAPLNHFQTNAPNYVIQSRLFLDYLPLQAIFETTHQALWASPIIPQHITCPTSAVIQSCIFHHIICPSKPFLNRHAKRCEPVPYFSLDYLPLQAIVKPTRQTLWSIPVIPYNIYH